MFFPALLILIVRVMWKAAEGPCSSGYHDYRDDDMYNFSHGPSPFDSSLRLCPGDMFFILHLSGIIKVRFFCLFFLYLLGVVCVQYTVFGVSIAGAMTVFIPVLAAMTGCVRTADGSIFVQTAFSFFV